MPLLKPLAALAVVTLLLNWAQQLTGTEWDWDINHMMYFGQRLLAGDFHWTVEFDDKLPINQMIFAIPAAFDSFRVWQVMSILACIGGAYAVRWLILYGLSPHPDVPQEARVIGAWTGALATLIGFSFAPGGIHHINPMAASAAIGAIALLTHAMSKPQVNVALVLLAAALASIAIGMRPYLALAVCAAPLWLALRMGRDLGYGIAAFIIWIGAITLFGLLANLLPYAALGEMRAFTDGLAILGQTLTPFTWKGVIYVQLKVFTFPDAPLVLLVFLSAIIAGVFALTKMRHSAYWRDVCVLSALMPFLIEVMILSKHFWPHYTQMFMPFFAIGAGVLMAQIVVASKGHMMQTAVAINALLLLLAMFGSGAGLWANRGATKDVTHIAQEFSQYLGTRPADAQDFLVPELMYIHWSLKEPRHGFPHAANSRHIAQQGWFQAVWVPAGVDLPTTTQSYCAKLEATGPSLVMSTYNAYVLECLIDSEIYARSNWQMPEHYGMNAIILFERRNSAGRNAALVKE